MTFAGFVNSPSASDPPSPSVGQNYFNTTLGRTRTWNGTSWVDGAILKDLGSVLNIAALTALDTSSTPFGQWVYVKSNDGNYFWHPGATDTADAQYIVTSTSGRWKRVFTCGPISQAVLNWYVDPVSGSDENTGLTSITALKTVNELNFRLGGVFSQNFSVFILNALVESQPLLRGDSLKSFPLVKVFGTRTTLLTGTITASAAVAQDSNLSSQITDTGVASWTPYVGQFIEITSGAQIGWVNVIAKDIGSNTARLGRWTSGTPTPNPTMQSTGTITAGSTYRIYDVTDVGLLKVSVSQAAGMRTGALIDCKTTATPDASGYFVFCKFNLTSLRSDERFSVQNCSIAPSSTLFVGTGAVVAFEEGVFFRNVTIETGAQHVEFTFPVFQGCTGTCMAYLGGKSGYPFITDPGFFDCTGAMVLLQGGGTVGMSSKMWGSGNSGRVFDISYGAGLTYAGSYVPTVVTSHATPIVLDGTSSYMPNIAANAGLTLPALSTIGTVSAFFAAPFSGNVMSYRTGSRINR